MLVVRRRSAGELNFLFYDCTISLYELLGISCLYDLEDLMFVT